MKKIPLLFSVLLTGCVITQRPEEPSEFNAVVENAPQYNPRERRATARPATRLPLDRKEIDQRAKVHENRGLAPKEARALAEIEYLTTGK